MILAAVIIWLLALPILEVCFILVMKMKDADITGPLYVPAYAFYLCAYAWDIICNLFVVPVIFIEFPHEFTVSARLQRLIDSGSGWRRNLALWFAVKLLNPFSNPPHIRVTAK
jgi:hypothetical protein